MKAQTKHTATPEQIKSIKDVDKQKDQLVEALDYLLASLVGQKLIGIDRAVNQAKKALEQAKQ